MEVNKETALRLWKTRYGRRQKAVDFSGRTMAKAAYGDRNSEFGWNLDHILPESKGGKSADYNLICCHIKTNDEKADRFPCFKANGQVYEILRRQNHYEIHSANGENNDYYVNFLDVGQTLDFIEKVEENIYSEEKEEENLEELFVGYVKVFVYSPERNHELIKVLYEFLNELFEYPVLIPARYNWSMGSLHFTILDFNIPKQEDTRNLLDKCIVLNTYIKYYFYKIYNCKIRIVCGMKYYESKYKLDINRLRDLVSTNSESSLFSTGLSLNHYQKYIINGKYTEKLEPTLIVSDGIAYNANIDNVTNDMELLEQIDERRRCFGISEKFYTYDCIFKKIKVDLNKIIPDTWE